MNATFAVTRSVNRRPKGCRNSSFTRRWLASAVCAAVITTPVLITAPAPAHAADSVFFVSGTRDNPAPQKWVDLADMGPGLSFFGTRALQIGYPASLAPFQGLIPLDDSVALGLANLAAALAAAPVEDRLVLIGISQGDIVLSLMERALVAAGSQRDIVFVRMAGPSGDTGVMGRNRGIRLLPGLSFVTRPAESPFDQIVLNHEYDGLGHWPVRQLNLLAVLNAALGILAFHNPTDYAVDLATFPEADITRTVNALGATTTTYLIRATGLLPLLRPLQALGVDDRLLGQWQSVLKPIIDSAYEPRLMPALNTAVQAMVRAVINSVTATVESVGTMLQRNAAPPPPPPLPAVPPAMSDAPASTPRLSPQPTTVTVSQPTPTVTDAVHPVDPEDAPVDDAESAPTNPVEPEPANQTTEPAADEPDPATTGEEDSRDDTDDPSSVGDPDADDARADVGAGERGDGATGAGGDSEDAGEGTASRIRGIERGQDSGADAASGSRTGSARDSGSAGTSGSDSRGEGSEGT